MMTIVLSVSAEGGLRGSFVCQRGNRPGAGRPWPQLAPVYFWSPHQTPNPRVYTVLSK